MVTDVTDRTVAAWEKLGEQDLHPEKAVQNNRRSDHSRYQECPTGSDQIDSGCRNGKELEILLKYDLVMRICLPKCAPAAFADASLGIAVTNVQALPSCPTRIMNNFRHLSV